MPQQIPVKSNDCYIELFDDCLHYIVDFIAEEPVNESDEKLGTKQIHNCVDMWVDKNTICIIEKSIIQARNWAVVVVITGCEQEIDIYFRTEEAATTLYEKLVNWRYGK